VRTCIIKSKAHNTLVCSSTGVFDRRYLIEAFDTLSRLEFYREGASVFYNMRDVDFESIDPVQDLSFWEDLGSGAPIVNPRKVAVLIDSARAEDLLSSEDRVCVYALYGAYVFRDGRQALAWLDVPGFDGQASEAFVKEAKRILRTGGQSESTTSIRIASIPNDVLPN